MSQKVIVSASVLSAIRELDLFLHTKEIVLKAASFKLLRENFSYRFYEVSIATGWHDDGEIVPAHARCLYISLVKDFSGDWHLNSVHMDLQDVEGSDLKNGVDPRNTKGGRNLLRDLDELEGIALESIASTCPEVLHRIDYRSVSIRPIVGRDDVQYMIVFHIRDIGKQNVGHSFVQVIVGEKLNPQNVSVQGEDDQIFNMHSGEWVKYHTAIMLAD